MPTERRLAAILFTDILGYTALMAESEEKGLRARERHRALVRPLVEQYHGESIEARGDESLSTFAKRDHVHRGRAHARGLDLEDDPISQHPTPGRFAKLGVGPKEVVHGFL